jgi:serine/threonine protein kinase
LGLGTVLGKNPSNSKHWWIVEEPHTHSADRDAAFEPGTTLRGTYQILHQLGAGGMGRVYAASHARLPGLFAVKALHKEFAKNENAVLRFRGEAEIMAGLRHPHIVQVFDFDVDEGGTPYLVMEFIEGRNLGERLRSGENMPPSRVVAIVSQIASALDAAHRRGVVHRDLKPENIMLISELGQDDFIKVVDFGISKAVGNSRLTSESTILGTPQFMAPEQAQGRHDEVDHRTDQFALAAMTYTLLSGVEPFRGQSPVTVLYQVVHEEAAPVAKRVDWPCSAVDAVLRKAMSKDIGDRYSSILEFSSALEAALQEDLRPADDLPVTLVAASAPHSFVRHQSANVTLEAKERISSLNTMVVARRRNQVGRPAARAAAVGLAAAALLAFAELESGPLQALRAALFAGPRAASAAVDMQPTLAPLPSRPAPAAPPAWSNP